MGEVAYKLELPEVLSGVHDVFHVSQLNRFQWYRISQRHVSHLCVALLQLGYVEHVINS